MILPSHYSLHMLKLFIVYYHYCHIIVSLLLYNVITITIITTHIASASVVFALMAER